MSDPVASGASIKTHPLYGAIVQAQKDGMKVTLGPGVEDLMKGFEGFADLNKSAQKDISNMKDLMSKSVEELAAQQDDTGLQVIKIRGRQLMIPTKQHQQRVNAIQIAALYAMDSWKVDDVLRQTKVHGRFMKPDGTVVHEPFVAEYEAEKVPTTSGNPTKVDEHKPGRNILVDAEPEETVETVTLKVGDPVVVLDDDLKTPVKMGDVESLAKGGGYVVRAHDGTKIECDGNRLVPVKPKGNKD